MKKFRIGLSQYRKPTPRNFRRLGDALLAMSTFVSVFAIAEDYKWIAFTAVMVGAIGKFFTNFFAKNWRLY